MNTPVGVSSPTPYWDRTFINWLTVRAFRKAARFGCIEKYTLLATIATGIVKTPETSVDQRTIDYWASEVLEEVAFWASLP
jgi:hypothetical protein